MGGKRKYVLVVVVTALISVMLTCACMLRYYYKAENMGRLRRVINMIESDYIGDFDIKKAEDKAIEAVVSSIGDKYAAYYNEKNAKQAMESVDGSFVGVGIEVFANTEKNVLEVISAYEDTPAFRAGIKSGDILYEIDGVKYTAGQLAEAALHMRGEHLEKAVNSEFKITVLRGNKKIELELKREKIQLQQIKTKITDDGMLYVRCSGFSDYAYKCLKKELEEIEKSEIKGIIMDLRNNPGGEFQSCIRMCDLFFAEGTIMYTENANGDKKYYNAHNTVFDYPLAVLINGASASASEIFAGSMQSRERGVIIGEKSFGKGVAQSLRYVNDINEKSGMLKMTTLKNFRPDGVWLNEGVTPDIEIKDEVKSFDEIEEDTLFKAAVKELQK